VVVMTPNQRCNGIQDLVEPDAGLEFKFHEPGQVKPGNLKAGDLGDHASENPSEHPSNKCVRHVLLYEALFTRSDEVFKYSVSLSRKYFRLFPFTCFPPFEQPSLSILRSVKIRRFLISLLRLRRNHVSTTHIVTKPALTPNVVDLCDNAVAEMESDFAGTRKEIHRRKWKQRSY